MKKKLPLLILCFAFLSAFFPQMASAQVTTVDFNELSNNVALGKS